MTSILLITEIDGYSFEALLNLLLSGMVVAEATSICSLCYWSALMVSAPAK